MSDTPPRLLLTADAVGGVWTHALDLVTALRMPVTLAVLGPGLDAARRAEAASIPGLDLVETGLPLDWLAVDETQLMDAGRAIAALAARCGASVVQLSSPALAIADFPCPVVGTCHSCLATWWATVRGGPMPSDFAWRSALLTRGLAGCDALVAPSAAFARATAQAHALPSAPGIIRNGRPPGHRATAADDIAFTAGRLWDEGKDLATLDRTAARLAQPIFAAGPLRGPNGAEVVLPHIHALGTLDARALRGWLARGPVFVSAARYEPFGLAVLEAAQAGCALVLSDIPTFRELWDGAAHFIAPGDDAGFAAALAALYRNREQRSRLGVAAMRRANRLTAEAMATGYAALHARLLRAMPTGRNVAA
jgi:glycosyltransferase involved in cell wall biosynthesis